MPLEITGAVRSELSQYLMVNMRLPIKGSFKHHGGILHFYCHYKGAFASGARTMAEKLRVQGFWFYMVWEIPGEWLYSPDAPYLIWNYLFHEQMLVKLWCEGNPRGICWG